MECLGSNRYLMGLKMYVVSSSLKLFCASYFQKADQADEVHGPFRRSQLHLRYSSVLLGLSAGLLQNLGSNARN
jgi:hypothetical protein